MKIFNFIKKLFRSRIADAITADLARVEYCEGCGKMLEYCICKTPTLLLAAPDMERYIPHDYFAHLILHRIEDELLKICDGRTPVDAFNMAIQIAELQEKFNRQLSKIEDKANHQPINVRIRKI